MNTMPHLSTSTPASEISSKSFDDGYASQDSEVPSLGDILRNSPAAALLGLKDESLPEEDEDVPNPEESDEDSPETSEETDQDLDEEGQSEETEEEKPDEDDTSTHESELPSEDDIDWEYKVPVTIDGKTAHLTLEEIRKGYSTDQHLSQKGRELGEQKKQLEVERSTKLQELVDLGSVLHAELTAAESKFEAEYVSLAQQIEKARDDGDTYTVRELKDKQEEVQKSYWEAHNKREQHTKGIREAFQKQQQEQQTVALKSFQENIGNFIPGFSDKTAKSIREFAIKEGISEQLLGQVYDPAVVKFIDDYRKLKTAKESGAMKRKETPTTKSVPTKKGTPQSAKAKEAQQTQRNKVLNGEGSQADQLDFLKNISTISKKLR